MDYAQRIRDLREDNDLNQSEIAKILNTTQQHYSRIEQGSTEITADRVILLANFYNVSTDYILGLTNNPKPLPKDWFYDFIWTYLWNTKKEWFNNL